MNQHPIVGINDIGCGDQPVQHAVTPRCATAVQRLDAIAEGRPIQHAELLVQGRQHDKDDFDLRCRKQAVRGMQQHGELTNAAILLGQKGFPGAFLSIRTRRKTLARTRGGNQAKISRSQVLMLFWVRALRRIIIAVFPALNASPTHDDALEAGFAIYTPALNAPP